MPHAAEDYLFFWKPEQEHGWASQWYPSTFVDEKGITYPTAEHYMMYQKAILFSDPNPQILEATDPKTVKQLGRAIHNFTDEVWNAHRSEIVIRGNMLKFGQNQDLRQQLLATGDKVLVEASPLDKIWGIGKGKERALDDKSSWGLNLLGLALMDVRKQLREKEDASRL
ncbi:SubName: Full=Uncharacterized protein {ECO:0000313/EMBL:CCA77961.1} [Serendipita indica DSM 11827]|uniref:NADAR domain-containing protein n=1 Tax=Serendipita indica (strain DSM 11827) TaxID=1109443 RepID=G4U2W5_SERID|nr:SubName: Full=Uncharacterized protein {ECO:0000313/EMBL:CCA77961.1} [Serendipita indica DSM 11827]CCA77961.1 hypothetical protein PIIN_00675 [Serendipita indica DSM 11827]